MYIYEIYVLCVVRERESVCVWVCVWVIGCVGGCVHVYINKQMYVDMYVSNLSLSLSRTTHPRTGWGPWAGHDQAPYTSWECSCQRTAFRGHVRSCVFHVWLSAFRVLLHISCLILHRANPALEVAHIHTPERTHLHTQHTQAYTLTHTQHTQAKIVSHGLES